MMKETLSCSLILYNSIGYLYMMKKKLFSSCVIFLYKKSMQRVRSTKVQDFKASDCLGCELPIDLTLLNGCSAGLNSESQDGVLKVLNPRLPSSSVCWGRSTLLGTFETERKLQAQTTLESFFPLSTAEENSLMPVFFLSNQTCIPFLPLLLGFISLTLPMWQIWSDGFTGVQAQSVNRGDDSRKLTVGSY